MTPHLCAVVLLTLPLLASAAENLTALKALQVLPKEEVKNLARIEAYDGAPLPERWHILVHDPNAHSGVREYVVAGGELVAARGVSQFADRLTQTDVIGNRLIDVDSDNLAQLAKHYAAANDMEITSVSYHLQRIPGLVDPLWRVNCRNAEGKAVGSLVVTTTEAKVISHEGFPLQPKSDPKDKAALAAATWEQESEGSPRSKPSEASASSSQVASATAARKPPRKATAAASKSNTAKTKSRPRSGRSSSARDPRELVAMPPEPVVIRRPSNPVRNFFRRFAR